MENNKGTILVIGASGVGKSTLINSIYGIEKLDQAPSGFGAEVTRKMDIYQTDPFYLIDSVGFANGFIGHQRVIRQIDKWKKMALKNNEHEKLINLIWYCIDGTSRRVFPQTIKHVAKVCDLWKGVPVIIVLTKSYSGDEVDENIKMARNAAANSKGINLVDIVAVVAREYPINREAGIIVPPYGVKELVEKSLSLIEGTDVFKQRLVADFLLQQKRMQANLIIGSVSACATGIGAVPIPIPDAAPLTLMQGMMIDRITAVYDIEKMGRSSLKEMLVELGIVTFTARQVLQMIKAIPGVNIAGAVLNAAVAGSFTLALGEVTLIVCEKINSGTLSLGDLDKIKAYAKDLLEKKARKIVEEVLPQIKESMSVQSISDIIGRVKK